MRTLIIMLAGFALWLACLGIAKMLGGTPAAYARSTQAFVAPWLLAAAGAAVFTKWKFL